jgi:hypothetical protein
MSRKLHKNKGSFAKNCATQIACLLKVIKVHYENTLFYQKSEEKISFPRAITIVAEHVYHAHAISFSQFFANGHLFLRKFGDLQ